MSYAWHRRVWGQLQQARQKDSLPHALLFQGEEGCGNEDFIRGLAQGLLCSNPTPSGHACLQCKSCQVFAAQAHPDFMQVTVQEERQAILIEQIRELNYFLGLSRSYSHKRVVIITPAEHMNVNAANSLLKSLEEPAENTHILLLTAHSGQLLPTIRSRCQQIRLPLPIREQAMAWLSQYTLTHEAGQLLDAAYGRPLQALALDSDTLLTQQAAWFQSLIQCTQGQGSITAISAQWEKFDRTLLLDWQLHAATILCRENKFSVGQPIPNYLLPLRQRFNKKNALELYSNLIELKKLAGHPLNPKLNIESMLMLWQVSC